jgi:hypothetical protein
MWEPRQDKGLFFCLEESIVLLAAAVFPSICLVPYLHCLQKSFREKHQKPWCVLPLRPLWSLGVPDSVANTSIFLESWHKVSITLIQKAAWNRPQNSPPLPSTTVLTPNFWQVSWIFSKLSPGRYTLQRWGRCDWPNYTAFALLNCYLSGTLS